MVVLQEETAEAEAQPHMAEVKLETALTEIWRLKDKLEAKSSEVGGLEEHLTAYAQ